MSSKRSDSDFATELLSMRRVAPATPLAARPALEQPTEEDFEGTETVVLASDSVPGPAGVPRLDDLRRLSKQIHQAERWDRNSR